MKYSLTNRRHHLRRLHSGRITAVRRHSMHYWSVKKKLMEGFKHDNPNATLKQIKRFNKYITPKRIDKLETELEQVFHVNLKDSDKDGVPDVVDCSPYDPTKQDEDKWIRQPSQEEEGRVKYWIETEDGGIASLVKLKNADDGEIRISTNDNSFAVPTDMYSKIDFEKFKEVVERQVERDKEYQQRKHKRRRRS